VTASFCPSPFPDSQLIFTFLRYRVLMDNFSPAQYERFEAYRRHPLPKQAVRKVMLGFNSPDIQSLIWTFSAGHPTGTWTTGVPARCPDRGRLCKGLRRRNHRDRCSIFPSLIPLQCLTVRPSPSCTNAQRGYRTPVTRPFARSLSVVPRPNRQSWLG
jgi:hypothetical protein